jgi:hypothetical protein
MTRATETELTVEGVRSARAAIEYCYDQGWTDGLPVVPPLPEFVDEFLAQTRRDPDEVVVTLEHLYRQCTVRQAAINAAMAGCRPEYFPVVLAALEAFRRIDAERPGLLQSTTGQAPLIIVNGPIRERLGFNSKGNVFGPGDRANATVGRALRLIIMNVFGIRPRELDQSTQGTPAKYSCCIAENEEESPWEPLHVERGFTPQTSTVTVQMIRGDVYVDHRGTQDPEEILLTIADSMSYGGGLFRRTLNEDPSRIVMSASTVVMGPEHAQHIARRGWSKQDVKRFLWEHFGRTKRDWHRFGRRVVGMEDQPDDAFVRGAESPDDILLVVAGAANAGVSTVCAGFVRQNATVPTEEPAS